MRKLVAMVSIVAMLGSTIGITNYEAVKAVDVTQKNMDTISGGAIKPEEQPSTEPSVKNTLENDDMEVRIEDFIVTKKYDEDEKEKIWWIESYLGNSSKVIIPDKYHGEKIEGIATAAFLEHTELEEVQLPKSLKIIDYRAFEGCTNLKKVEIPETVEIISIAAFQGCEHLKNLQLPKALHTVYGSSFEGAGMENFSIDNKNSFFTTVDGVIYNKKCTILVAVPPRKSKLELPKTVTKVDYCAAVGNKQLTEVDFSSALKTIDNFAFENCSTLKKVKFSKTLKTIGKSAFKGCSTLKEVKFSNALKTIEEYAFRDCKKIKEIVIPASVINLNHYAFMGCDNIKTFKINKNNKKYSVSSGNLYNKNKTVFFASVTNKETVTLLKSVKEVKNLALLCGGNVKKIKVEKGNKYFSDYDNALYNKRKTKLYACPESKTSILLPATLTSIGSGLDEVDEFDDMFGKVKKIQVKTGNKKYSSYKGLLYNKKQTRLVYAPKKIKSILFPKTLVNINALEGRGENVTSIAVDVGNKTFQVIDGILYNKKVTKVLFCTKNKKTVLLPETVKSIGKYAFYGCNKLKNITFPEKLEELEGFSFKNCSSLEYVKFPDDAGKVSDDFKKRICIYPLAFMNCSSLKWVYAPENMYFWGEANKWIFIGCNNLNDIYYSGSENEWLDCVNQSVLDDVWELYSDYKNSMTVEPLLTIHYEAKAPL